MKKYIILSKLFYGLSIMLFGVMCAVVLANYTDMIWGIKYAGYSAPAEIAFLTAIPYAITIIITTILGYVLDKRNDANRKVSRLKTAHYK